VGGAGAKVTKAAEATNSDDDDGYANKKAGKWAAKLQKGQAIIEVRGEIPGGRSNWRPRQEQRWPTSEMGPLTLIHSD